MPQLIAMVIVVVGAMIYMFQTFGGTGDKIEGIAQKTSVITEINNIKNGLKLAARAQHIASTATGDASNNLLGLANLAYFPEQINDQIKLNADATNNSYNAISFGGSATDTGGMILQLVAPAEVSSTPPTKRIPGIYVEFTGNLEANKAFLESQISTDLEAVAYIDRAATTATAAAGVKDNAASATSIDKRTPAMTSAKPTTTQLSDGKFIIYFKDFGSDEVVQ